MKNAVKLRICLMTLLAIGLSMNALFVSDHEMSQAQTNSVASSQPSATPAGQDDGLRAACAEAVEELKAARQLLRSQGALIERQNELADLQTQIETGLKDLRRLDADEKQHLRNAVAAANRQIAALEAEVAVLKKQRTTFWKKAKWFVFGGLAGVAVCVVACK